VNVDVDRYSKLKQLWKSSRHSAARNRFSLLRRFAEHDQTRFTPPFLDETQAARDKRPRFAPGLLPSALVDLSYLYAHEPVRSTDNDEAWKRALWGNASSGLSSLLYEADPLIRLGGTCLAVVLPTPPENGDEWDGTLSVSIFEADRFVAIADPKRPQRVLAALIRWGDPIVPKNDARGIDEDEADWVYIDDQVLAHINKNSGVSYSEEPHGVTRCPACTLKNGLASKSLYGPPLGGPDLVVNLTTVNLFYELVIFTGELQRGQPCAANPEKAKNLVLSPNCIIEVADVGGFWYASNGANIPYMVLALQLALDSLAIGIGLPKRTWNVRATLDGGIGVYENQQELTKDRLTRERLGGKWEFDIHDVARLVLASHGVVVPPLGSVRYLPFTPPTTATELIAKVETEASLGLADREKQAADLNPDLPPEEIKERVELATEEQERVMQLRIQEAGHSELATYDTKGQ
jgi:hypothetical protein